MFRVCLGVELGRLFRWCTELVKGGDWKIWEKNRRGYEKEGVE